VNDELDLLRAVIATICLLLGGVLLIPAADRLLQWLLSRGMPTLPDPAVSFVLLLNDRPIDSDAVIAAAAVAGASLVLIGFKVLK
jgi:hypothetical protein